MIVKNMVSNSGREVPNQFIVINDNITWFQSYKSMISKKEMINGKIVITLDSYYWDYSTTTGKYRNLFLNEKKEDTQKKINSGEYVLTNLN